MSHAQTLNPGLARLHRILCLVYFCTSATGVLFAAMAHYVVIALVLWGVIPLPFAVLHWYAAKGAEGGKAYGRFLSQIIAILFLLGFPVGTAIAVYIFIKTGKRWEGEDETLPWHRLLGM